jgi:ATP-dependent Clp protease ATP-binding subunit ClpA
VEHHYSDTAGALASQLSAKVLGQNKAIDAIVPYVLTHQAGLAPAGRPLAVFLLLGPTGTGKTRTVEALAEALHGSARHMLKIDCGEFHLEHEIAKLIGAPPGYLGHRETHPILTQARLTAVTSRSSDISIVLFDEIEKAAPSMTRLLLGVLDKATLRLGDNTSVNFEKSIVFLTSNLGATAMMKRLERGVGFPVEAPPVDTQSRALESIALAAARRHFSPEFMNRIDSVVTYEPLQPQILRRILELQIREMQEHIDRRLGIRSFQVRYTAAGKRYLLAQGSSSHSGAREIKRTLQRYVMQPLAAMVARGDLTGFRDVTVDYSKRKDAIAFRTGNL